ncbi:MAG: response regulator, partial [Nitrospirales bacterium]|nr:response regulator [Nitrospirales bacterium]
MPMSASLRTQKVLCVDDNAINLKLLDAVLLPRGYDTVHARSGPEALEILKSQDVDIVLLDVMMPGMDGYEVCRRIKDDIELWSTPVVMIT